MSPGLSSLANWSNVTLFLSLFGADYFLPEKRETGYNLKYLECWRVKMVEWGLNGMFWVFFIAFLKN